MEYTIIIGAGLSGLLTAYRLKREGIPFKVLEARSRIGGRIYTLRGINDTPLEMGATWFNNQHKHLISLLEELDIEYFEQYMDGTAFYQPFSTAPAQSIQIPSQSPSHRVSGGTSHLINRLYQQLEKTDVLLNECVNAIRFDKNSIQVTTTTSVFKGDKVVLTIPPKLWAKNISFEPSLPGNVMDIALETHTWMEDSIKVALAYNRPFWRDEKLSGTLFSNTGPITEFYDHCNLERSKFALCGFINPAFSQLTYSERRLRVIDQLKNVFGANAEEFIDYEECVWSEEKYTFQATNVALYPHQNNGNPIFSQSYFDDRLLISGSEASLEFPGYMDGAVYSANATVEKILKAQQLQ